MTRYFRSSPEVYAEVCAQLDAAYGYPLHGTTSSGGVSPLMTLRSLPLGETLPTDGERVYLEVSAEYCEYDLPSVLLPQLIAAGLVEEIDWATYWEVIGIE